MNNHNNPVNPNQPDTHAKTRTHGAHLNRQVEPCTPIIEPDMSEYELYNKIMREAIIKVFRDFYCKDKKEADEYDD